MTHELYRFFYWLTTFDPYSQSYLTSIFLDTADSSYRAVTLNIGDLNQKGRGLFLIFAIMNLSVLRLDDESAKKMLLGTGTALILLVSIMTKNYFTGHPHGFYDGSGPPLPVIIFLAILCLSSFYFSIFKKG